MVSKFFICLAVLAFAAVAFASENERVKKAVIIGGPGALGYAHGYATPYSHAYNAYPYGLARGYATPYNYAYNSLPYSHAAYNAHAYGYSHPWASYGKTAYNYNGYHPYSSWNGLHHGLYNNYYGSAYPYSY
ncbi:uncharacterized protein LOC126894853 isoform X2 [Daktulosphaira vitifoliae]|uniref:uncharacterized protein LOC126894853 isoform X2 n=1 Tax=Daktulosphaira vitifoliae TaxID=58002 RepID=UPI0021A9B99B|nr:uncharacterized protein LOC126894853 isoform X2 [Daktulosphaira vitifoliae]